MSRLSDFFDSVIILTASDWFSEPRSNRYHYASRFARELPTYFVQFDQDADEICTDACEIENLTIVHANRAIPSPSTDEPHRGADFTHATRWLRDQGCHRPLVWIYNPLAVEFAKHIPAFLTVYHATEIYLSGLDELYDTAPDSSRIIVEKTSELIAFVDLVVAVSDGVSESISASGLARRPVLDVFNGVDADYWIRHAPRGYKPREDGRPVALFQGGINVRLDYPMIAETAQSMHDWEFWFFGAEDETITAWQEVKKLENVRAFGPTPLPEIGRRAAEASVGWAPFRNIASLRRSMPLKMYEYVACGLPVVSIPIDGLAGSDDHLFRFAENAEEFESQLRRAADTRSDPQALVLRDQAVRANSYDVKFNTVVEAVADIMTERKAPKSILILYDEKYSHFPGVYWHLKSFSDYSRNRYFYLPASTLNAGVVDGQMFGDVKDEYLDRDGVGVWDFNAFDAVVVHYGLRTSVKGYIPKYIKKRMAEFGGPKILFVQDEYENTDMTKKNMVEMGITTVFTCVPEESREFVYSSPDLQDLTYQSTLTGYVPEDTSFTRMAKPLKDRSIAIGYRGRQLPHHYGRLGFEKMIIGERVKQEALARELTVDIETDDSKRIYRGWHEFLGNCRATLGTESGSNIFDFDDSLRAKAQALADRPFEEVYGEHFEPHEGLVRMNQISPKFFEAILMKTALICFPGNYSGILKANRHYIPLEKDFSNIDEVFEKLMDDEYIQELTERAYREIISSGRYSYRAFINEFDDWLDGEVRSTPTEIITAPIAIRRHGRIKPLLHPDTRALILNSAILDEAHQREVFRSVLESNLDADEYGNPVYRRSGSTVPGRHPSHSSAIVEAAHKLLPDFMKQRMRRLLKQIVDKPSSGRSGPLMWMARKVGARLPVSAKRFLIQLVQG
ncbi:glycosyltransferase [Pyruvatibacter mobilis]|uniref:glycosyltransferase n=1 Tax=Pyruvatibacter mobilis TaxID=1712261 RepID=UPI003C7A6291